MKRPLYRLLIIVCLLAFTTAQAAGGGGDFRQVARTSIPAVVSIKSEGMASTPQRHSSDPRELFGPELFQYFFGKPPAETVPQPRVGLGSGLVVSEDGYILTNNHVVEKALQITVTMHDGSELVAKLIGQDPGTDLALIQVEGSALPFLKLGDSSQLEIGEWVVAIGNPLGLQASLTAGVVSATGRNNLSIAQVEDFIQTDAAINRGNSGGPLLNLEGEVVGINTAIATNTGGYMGIGFSIPSNIAKHVMNQLIANGSVSRGFIGVTLQAIDKDLANAFGINNSDGGLISEILPDSPARKSGLKQGDIITQIDGKAYPSIAALRNAIALNTPGTTLKMTVVRKGKTIEIPVTIGDHPSNAGLAQANSKRLGLQVGEVSGDTDEGVLVTEVAPNSPASKSGIRKGAIILAVNQRPVASVLAYQEILNSVVENDRVLLLVKQGSAIRFIALKAE